ncbi:MAG: glycosyltransferase family 2 protein, partial [bacterium]|nr:glycosyltransferase family 2 protein [bacterium]
MCKVTVYIPTYNYARYLAQAIDSVLAQTLDDWELIVINDGSTDNTSDVLDAYRDNPRIRIIDQENKGLNVTNNIALRLARGKYITRLDGDDYMDENLLQVLSNALDARDDIGLVYPDYYHVDEGGEVIEIVRREKLDDETQLLDLPAHGACTMFRRDLLREVGGYIEDFTCQDGYE